MEFGQRPVEIVEMNSGFWRKKKILLTGHTGFKGSWLSLWLQELGVELVGYALPPPTEPSLFALANVAVGMHSCQGDVLDLEHLRKVLNQHEPEIVFHLAAQSLVRESYAHPVGTFSTNVIGTAHVLEAVRTLPSIRGVLIVTSDKCYENRGDDSAHCETDRLGGDDPYSASKACAEMVTSAYRHSFFQEDKLHFIAGVASARAGNVIGGGDWASDRLIPDAVRSALQRTELRVRNPDAVRPWQHVLEPLRGYLMLAEQLCNDPKRFSGSWNFGPEKADIIPVRQILDRLQNLSGKGFTWSSDPGAHPPETRCLRLDSAKSRTELGWQPHWHLDSALRATVDWHKSYEAGKDMRVVTEQQIRSYQSHLPQPEILG